MFITLLSACLIVWKAQHSQNKFCLKIWDVCFLSPFKKGLCEDAEISLVEEKLRSQLLCLLQSQGCIAERLRRKILLKHHKEKLGEYFGERKGICKIYLPILLLLDFSFAMKRRGSSYQFEGKMSDWTKKLSPN